MRAGHGLPDENIRRRDGRGRWVAALAAALAGLWVPACTTGEADVEGGNGGSDARAGGALIWVGRDGRLYDDTLTAIDPATGKVARGFPVGNLGHALAIGDGAIWAPDPSGDLVRRIDPKSGRADSIPLPRGSHPGGIAIGQEAVWVGTDGDSKVIRIDPRTRKVVATIPVGADEQMDHALRLAVGGGSVWVMEFFGKYDLHRIDPATNQVAGRVKDVGDGVVGIAFGEGSVWVVTTHDDRVNRIDPATLQVVSRTRVGKKPFGVAVGEGAVWVVDQEDNTVSRVDPQTNRLVASIPVGANPKWVAVAGGSVWVTNLGGGSVTRIDPRTNQVTATIPVGPRPLPIAAR